MDVRLIYFKKDGAQGVVRLKPGRHIVGRKEEAAFRIPLPSVSREHCEIVHDGAHLRVRDLGSSNGTYCNNQRVQEAELRPGDVLTVGPLSLTIQIDGNPTSVEPPRLHDTETEELMDTPPEGTRTIKPGAEDEGLDESKTRNVGPQQHLHKPSAGADESSVFDFDFDLADEDRPQL